MAPVYSEHVTDVRLTFEEHRCELAVTVDRTASSSLIVALAMCQCREHMKRQLATLRMVMALVTPRVEQLVVEDYFLLRESFVAKETLDVVLGECAERGDRLRWLEMHNVDMSKVRTSLMVRLYLQISTKCLLLIGRMKQLGQLSLVQCGIRVSLSINQLN